jgi:hypothetical protein
MSGVVPSASSAVWTLAAVTLKRLGRGKALWIGALIAALPVAFAVGVRGHVSDPTPGDIALLTLVMLPAMFVGASIGEDIEERTTTYLWSRPIARWAILAGKLCALVPVLIALVVTGLYAAWTVWRGSPPSPVSGAAFAAGCVAASMVAAGIATLVPRHGMALTIAYMLVDLFVGAMPFSLNQLSITRHVSTLANLPGELPAIQGPVIGLVVIAAVWGAIGVLRIRRLEA